MGRTIVLSGFDGPNPEEADFRAKTGVAVLAVSSDRQVVDQLRKSLSIQTPAVGPETRMIEQACRDAAMSVVRPDVSDLTLPVPMDREIPIRVVIGEPALPLLTIDQGQARAVPIARVLPKAPRLSGTVVQDEPGKFSRWKSFAAIAAAALIFFAVFLIH